MPCYSRIRVTMTTKSATTIYHNIEATKAACEKAGMVIRDFLSDYLQVYDPTSKLAIYFQVMRDGKIKASSSQEGSGSGLQETLDSALKRVTVKYSEVKLREAAQKMGFTITQNGNTFSLKTFANKAVLMQKVNAMNQ